MKKMALWVGVVVTVSQAWMHSAEACTDNDPPRPTEIAREVSLDRSQADSRLYKVTIKNYASTFGSSPSDPKCGCALGGEISGSLGSVTLVRFVNELTGERIPGFSFVSSAEVAAPGSLTSALTFVSDTAEAIPSGIPVKIEIFGVLPDGSPGQLNQAALQLQMDITTSVNPVLATGPIAATGSEFNEADLDHFAIWDGVDFTVAGKSVPFTSGRYTFYLGLALLGMAGLFGGRSRRRLA